jgi:hypothetical protein
MFMVRGRERNRKVIRFNSKIIKIVKSMNVRIKNVNIMNRDRDIRGMHVIEIRKKKRLR